MDEEMMVMEKTERGPDMETRLALYGNNLFKAANAIMIEDEIGYESAGSFLTDVKAKEKEVKDYWKPLKEQAKAAHQNIVDREKAMLKPLVDAEAVIKKSMLRYQAEVEAERRRAEEEAAQKKAVEADRLLAEAIKSEENGDLQAAAIGVAMAEMVQDMPTTVVAQPAPTASGTHITRTWKARVTDPEKVPVMINGIEVRTINMSALNQIAKLTKGSITVPGVEFYQEEVLAARAR